MRSFKGEKGHNAILLDAFFGNKDLSIFEKSEKEYDVIAERDHIRSLSSKVKEEEERPENLSLEKMYWEFVLRLILYFLLCTWKKRRRWKMSGNIRFTRN